MKILVHTGHLAERLSKIDFYSESVSHCEVEHDTIYIHTPTKRIEINCAAESEKDWIWQNDRRWDWVMDLAKSFPDCPVVLDVEKEHVKAIFEF